MIPIGEVLFRWIDPDVITDRGVSILSLNLNVDVDNVAYGAPFSWSVAGRSLTFADALLEATGGTLRVERSVEETKSGLRIKSPKTKRGRRNITLPPEAVAMLWEHKLRQMELRLALGQGG